MAERFYWLKLQRDFFKRHDVRIVENMPNGKDYVLFYLKLLCESIDHEGRLRFSDSIPYNDEMLSTITDTNIDIVRSAVKIFTELGLMELQSDGTYFMNEVEKMIGSAAGNAHALRQRRYIENKKQRLLNFPEENEESVTNSDGMVTDNVTNSDESKSKSKSKNNISSSSNDSEDIALPPVENPLKRVPYQQILNLYYELCPNMSKIKPVTHFTDEIKKNVRARWTEYKGDLEAFKTVFTKAEASDFLNNRADTTFQASFDWLMRPKNFSKAINGNFDNLKKRQTIKGTDIEMSIVADGSDRSKYNKTEWD